MRTYFLRRLILVPPTVLGITLIVFFVTRIVPGGPIEQAMMDSMMNRDKHSALQPGHDSALSPEQIDQLKQYYGFDKPWYVGYVLWLGKIVRGDLGTSYRYDEPVWDLLVDRLPVSLFYGTLTLVITYGVCIPLGIVKALRHSSWIDTGTSFLIFAGQAVPGYVLGGVLLAYFAARLRWFPMGGFVGEDFSQLSFAGRIIDLARHAVLPMCCYLVGSFAFVTLVLKNQLLENLAADYMRTAAAKGVPRRTAIFRHALRNSLIPVATVFGGHIGLILFGSFLVETVFDINGIGLLGYTSVVDRDYPVVMAILLISSLLLLLGNIISDVLVALVDPRVKFG